MKIVGCLKFKCTKNKNDEIVKKTGKSPHIKSFVVEGRMIST